MTDPTIMLGTSTATGTLISFQGYSVANAIDAGLSPHHWVADGNGLFHTTTDLQAEWVGDYEAMLHGLATNLTPIQRLEGNAEAVFENTGLARASPAQQQAFREDAQREFDAIAVAMTMDQHLYSIDPNAVLTQTAYLDIEHTIQSNPLLEELAVQGHGLNSPPSARYDGFTSDFQNNVDDTTKYIGGGLNNDGKAIADFFDDNILSHVPFPSAFINGHFDQLNQNGQAENTVSQALAALDTSMYTRVYKATDFSQTVPITRPKTGGTATPPATPVPTPPMIRSLMGYTIANTITTSNHIWVADANGLFQTTTDLSAEWKTLYQEALSGQAFKLTAIQRLEANAEAVFENTGLAKLGAAQQETDREDAQREFDAIGGAMQIDASKYGISVTAPLTAQTYLTLENTLQSSPALEELAIQGHGLNKPPAARYDGYTRDFQDNVDQTTKYIGGGLNNGGKAIADFFDDNILTHVPFATVMRNGTLVQLNQNGAVEQTLTQAVTAMNQSMFYRIYTSADFKQAS